MKLSIVERKMLANQNRILAALDKANKKDYLYKAEIAEHGYEGLYDELFESVVENGTTEEVCEETELILSMFTQIKNGIAGLSAAEKKTLDLKRLKFEGFDGNHDKHYHYMRFIVNKGDLFEEYKNTNMNSHSISTLGRYKKMLSLFNKKVNSDNDYKLDVSILTELSNIL